jgi:hypothetical protein
VPDLARSPCRTPKQPAIEEEPATHPGPERQADELARPATRTEAPLAQGEQVDIIVHPAPAAQSTLELTGQGDVAPAGHVDERADKTPLDIHDSRRTHPHPVQLRRPDPL